MTTNVVWFTNNLRIKDNEALHQAAQGDKVIAVYCFDPRQYQEDEFGFIKTAKFRTKFLLETVENLKKNLASLNISLLVYHKKPEDIIPELVKKYEVTKVFYQEEWTRDEVKVINTLQAQLPTNTLHPIYSQFLFEPSDIPFASFDKIPQVFTEFRKKCEKYGTIKPVVPVPQKKSVANLLPEQQKLPTLATLGHEVFAMDVRTAFPFWGGEDSALTRLRNYFWETNNIAIYKKTRNGLVGKNYSSKLSAWLANGAISARTIYYEVKKYEQEVKKNQDTYWMVFELLWRDYFKYVSLKHGDAIFKIDGILNKNYQWKSSEAALHSWINGETTEPFVNANMIELKKTGWMSNRGRQNVASFWAKELKQDWRIGAAYFESMLLDYDVHSNWGNWMYNSGVGNDPRDRKFNIQRQAEMYDSKGTFRQLWLQQILFS